MPKNQPYLPRALSALLLLSSVAALRTSAQAQDQTAPAAVPTTAEVAAQGATDQVVKMEAFNVSTSIGNYHEDTSSMATKVPTDLKDIASALQILNATALSDRDTLKLQDVYTYIIGMSQDQTNANGFSFRGFANTGSFTQNIEYDGLQGGVAQKGALSAVDVQSVEFLKGPNSVLYGQMHPGGLLNIVTKSPQQVAQASITGEYSTYAGDYGSVGQQNSYIGTIDLTGPIDAGKHWLYRIVASDQDQKPFRNGDWEKDTFIYPSLTYRWNADTSFTIKVEDVRIRRRQDDGLIPIFPGASYGPGAAYALPALNTVYQEPTDTGLDKGQAYSAFFQTRIDDRWVLRVSDRNVYHRDITREFTQQSQTVVVASPLQNSTIKRNYNNFNNAHRYSYFDSNLYGTLGPKSFENTLLIGVGGGTESFDNHRLGNGPVAPTLINLYTPLVGLTPYPADGTKITDTKQYLSNLGEYVSDMIRLGDRWHVTIGTRHDQQVAHGIDVFNPVASPYVHQFVTAETSQLGVVYDITKELSAYASASQSFVPNAVTTLDANGNSGNFPAETGYQFEGGLKFQTPDHNLFASLDTYFINRTNVVVQTPVVLQPSGENANRLDGEQHSEGFEFETEWLPFPYWQFQGGFALGKAFSAESAKTPQIVGSDLANAPRESASLWTRYNVPDGPMKGGGAGLGVVNTGSTWTGDPTTAFYFRVPGWTRVDGDLYYKWKRYEVSLDCKNLLDRHYILIPQSAVQLYPGEPRKLTVTATTHF